MRSVPSPTVIDAQTIRDAVPLDHAAIATVEDAFTLSADGRIEMPTIQQITPPGGGQTCIKSAFAQEGAYFVTKLSSIYPANASKGLPTASGLMMLVDADTGYPAAILLDGGWLTAVRTAAAGAVAAKWLARSDSRRVTVVGSGRQARLQVEALKLIFALERVTICARDPTRGRALADALGADGLEATFMPGLDRAVAGADIVVTATSARAPVFGVSHVRPGLHVTAMGADAPGKSELGPGVLAMASIYACDSVPQCLQLGEAAAALARGEAPPANPVAIGSLIGRTPPAPRAAEAVTVADLTGIGAQDLRIAMLAMQRIGWSTP